MYAMQGYGNYHGYNGFGDAASAQVSATLAYGYLQTGDTTTALQTLNNLSAADKTTACQQMTTQAASDTDTTMKAKVSSLCASAGVSQGFLGLSTTTWIVIGVGGIGLIYLLSSKKKR